MKLFRILVDASGGVEPRATTFDLIVWAKDEAETRKLALAHLSTTGHRRRVVPGSIVEVVPDHARVVAQETVAW